MYAKCEDPNSQWGLCPSVSWGKDYPDGFTFGPPLFSQDAIGPESCCNDPMVGITPEMLQERGYDPSTEIPSAEDQIDACIPLSGDERLQCWAELDQYLMEDVTPVDPVPVRQQRGRRLRPDRGVELRPVRRPPGDRPARARAVR